MTDKKNSGEHVDSKNIRKHKNDVFRLAELIDPDEPVTSPVGVLEDMHAFLRRMKDEPVDLKQLGITGTSKEKILAQLEVLYHENI